MLAFENGVYTRVSMRYVPPERRAGGTPMPAVGPLVMNAALGSAARGHSEDMATANYFSHTSPDGRSFVDRMLAAGYGGGGPHGENIAAGYGSPAAVVLGDLDGQ